jgi:hypothetical protein
MLAGLISSSPKYCKGSRILNISVHEGSQVATKIHEVCEIEPHIHLIGILDNLWELPALPRQEPKGDALVDITKANNVSEMHSQRPNNGDGHILTLSLKEDSYKWAYEAGLASGREEGYQRGYREGFADCAKFGDPTPVAAETRNTSTCESRETRGERGNRLRGLPCAKCGCPSYGDESQCSRCGTPKVNAGRKQLAAVEES